MQVARRLSFCFFLCLFSAQPAAAIRNGDPTGGVSSVGLILRSDGNRYIPTCSGVLVAQRQFLTATHCFDDTPEPSRYLIYFQHDELARPETISTACGDARSCPPGVALVTLHAASSAEPSPIASTVSSTAARIVGFGIGTPDESDFGVKRIGTVVLHDCDRARPTRLCFRASASGHLNCFADSGGPVFSVSPSGQFEVVGVLQDTYGPCGIADSGSASDVVGFQIIASETVALPRDRADRVVIAEVSGVLGAYPDSEDVVIRPPPGTTKLLVNLNFARASQVINGFDVAVVEGAELSCWNAADSVRSCIVPRPFGRTVTVRVNRTVGEGPYQLAVTAILRPQ